MDMSYATACVLKGATVAYLAAREIALDEVKAAAMEWGVGDPVRGGAVEEALDLMAGYSNGDVPQVDADHHAPDFDMGLVTALAQHVDDEGEYEGHRTGVVVVAARAAELVDEIAEFGETGEWETAGHQAALADLAGYLSRRYQIPTDAAPRYNTASSTPAGGF